LSYHSIRVNDFPVFAGGVRDGIYGNPVPFATPPITDIAFQALLDDYNNKRYAYEKGGSAQKGPYLDAKENLMEALDTTAEYVDEVADGEVNVILLSGFVPTKGNRSDAPAPDQPTDVKVKRGKASGILLVECAAQSNAVSYGCIMTANEPLPPNVVMNEGGQMVFADEDAPENGGGEPITNTSLVQGVIDFNPGRRKKFQNLTPGTTYYFTFYAANATGVSPFSTPVSLMCA